MINLEKGQNSKLSMNIFHVGLGWDVKEDQSTSYDFDLDVTAFLVGDNKKILADDYFVFYNSEKRVKANNTSTLIQCNTITGAPFANNDEMRHLSRPVDPELSVIGPLDDESGEVSENSDDEVLDINLNKVRPEVKEIYICVSIHKSQERKQNFGQVERAYVRLFKPGQGTGDGEYIYDLTEDFSTCTAIEFCRLYRKDNDWKVQALGTGHKGGLEELLTKFA